MVAREAPQVLVLEDEPDMCWALENILVVIGYNVTTATRGSEALDLLARGTYDAVFLDAKLPDQNGLELAVLIRQRWPSLSIVLISGYFYQEDADIREGVEEGLFLSFVPKPFDLEDIRLAAERAVARTREARDLNCSP